jgi:hypothetical protein
MYGMLQQNVTDPVNRYENHDVSITATVQGEYTTTKEQSDAMDQLKAWVLKNIQRDVQEIRES